MGSCSRRRFTAMTGSTLLMPTALLTACSVSPATLHLIIQATELVFTIWNAVDVRGGPVHWSDEATQALNQLVDRTVGMSDELKPLGITINTKSSLGISDAEKTMKARMQVFVANVPLFEQYQSLKDPNPKKAGLESLAHEVEQDVFMCCGLGPAAYQTTYTATVIVRAMYKYLGRTPDEQRPFFERVNKYFASWVSQTVDDSPAKLLDQEERRLKELNDQLAKSDKQTTDWLWEKLYRHSGRERDRLTINKDQLGQVMSQLNNYEESLADVINGGRLKNPKSHHS
jgi:hypothetical protein